MPKGNIVLANTKTGIIPAAVRFFTNSKFSHSLITVPDLIKVPMCIEAASNGVDCIRFDLEYIQNSSVEIEIWEVNIPDAAKDAGILAALDKLETNYGYLELPWFAWRWLNLKFGRDIKNQNNWCENGEICSQLAELFLTAGGQVSLFSSYGKGAVAPQDLRNIMVANPAIFKLSFSNMT